MEQSLVVDRGEGRAELPGDLDPLLLRQPADALQERGQVFAVDELHRQERLAGVLGDVVDAADVRVADPPGGRHLLAEPGEPVGVGGEVWREELEGDRLAEGQVVGPVHLPHPASAEGGDDPVPAGEDRARGESLTGVYRRERLGVRPGQARIGLGLGGHRRSSKDSQNIPRGSLRNSTQSVKTTS